MTFDVNRYNQLQDLRAKGQLTDDQQQELISMAQLKLFLLIQGDVDLAAVFRRLKDR